MITFKVGDVLRRISRAVSLKVLLRMTHWNKLVVDCMKEEGRNRALTSRLNWVQSVEVETTRGLLDLHADLRPHHLHECLGRHARHDLTNHTLCNVFEFAE